MFAQAHWDTTTWFWGEEGLHDLHIQDVSQTSPADMLFSLTQRAVNIHCSINCVLYSLCRTLVPCCDLCIMKDKVRYVYWSIKILTPPPRKSHSTTAGGYNTFRPILAIFRCLSKLWRMYSSWCCVLSLSDSLESYLKMAESGRNILYLYL
jgi:hypothetical protein